MRQSLEEPIKIGKIDNYKIEARLRIGCELPDSEAEQKLSSLTPTSNTSEAWLSETGSYS